MNDVPVTLHQGIPPALRGGGFKAEQAKIDAIIGYAAKVMDLALLEESVDRKIADQQEFVSWWQDNVSSRLHTNQHNVVITDDVITRERAESATGISAMQVSRWRKSLKDAAKYRARLILAACRKFDLTADENHRAEGTGDNQWFTPEQYIGAARAVMGGIDLDPASHPVAQQTVNAERFFTPEDDGLKQEWIGRVWLNPPYAQPLIGQFVDKLLEEHGDGRVSDAIMLTHNYTDTSWFHRAEALATLICFTRGRIKFVDEDGDECAPTQGQAFFYYGRDRELFESIFSQFGFIR